MSKIKINLDRLGISSGEISKRMNFEDILTHHQVMAKPFYKSAWFYGVSGLATVSLIAGSIYSMEPEGDKLSQNNLVMESLPNVEQEKIQIENELISEESEVLEIIKETKKPIEETNTLITATTNQESVQNDVITELEDDDLEIETLVENKTFSFMDLYPRISGHINGGITKEELLNDEGLVTKSDVKIISFQLHLIDGTGGRVFESSGNVLNSEMKTAINTINVGEEIYFEQIDGQAVSGEIVRLSPLKYVLLN